MWAEFEGTELERAGALLMNATLDALEGPVLGELELVVYAPRPAAGSGEPMAGLCEEPLL